MALCLNEQHVWEFNKTLGWRCEKCGYNGSNQVSACAPSQPSNSLPETVLDEAARLTTHDRQSSYGHPLDDYTRTVGMFNAAFAHKLKEPLTAEEMMAAMILVKVSREIHLPKRDNRVDIAGYVNCIDMAMTERERRG